MATDVVLLGPPGAGKGTQGDRIAAALGVPKIATGDVLRAAVREGTPLGLEAKAAMDRGDLVPDAVILGIMKETLAAPAAANGSVLDGVVRAVSDTNRLVRLHHHHHFDGTLLHVRAGNDHADRPNLQSALWAAHAAHIESIELPFLHAELTGRDATARIAPWLDARLAVFDAR